MISQQNAGKRTEEMTVVVLLILEVQLAVADMVQVLEPLEVGDADATGVGVHVRDDKDFLVLENLVSRWGDGTIGTLRDEFSLDDVGVVDCDLTLLGSGHKDVALLTEKGALGVGLSTGEAGNTTVGLKKAIIAVNFNRTSVC